MGDLFRVPHQHRRYPGRNVKHYLQLALTALGREASSLTELLRGKTGSPEALESFARVKEKYILTKKGIEDLQAGE